MKSGAFVISLLFLCTSPVVHAAREAVLPHGSFCDTEQQVCLRGRIDFDRNRKVMEIKARLYRTAGPGVLTFEFVGTTPLDEQVYHSTSVELRGHYRESISHKIGPPYSNRTRWSLYRLTFVKH